MSRLQTPDIMGDVLVAKSGPELIPLNRIRVDGGTQMRAALNEDTVKEYADAFMTHHAWGDFPPVILYYDGTDYWVADGFHRIEAYRRVVGGDPNTTPVHADVRAGNRRDAILYAAGANAAHGLRRTQADKRRSVETLLRDDEWRKWSDREIARICHVSADLVGDVRKTIAPPVTVDSDSEAVRTYTNRHGGTSTMHVQNIGSNQPQYAQVWELERHVAEYAQANGWQAPMLRRVARNQRGDLDYVLLESAITVEHRRADLVQALHNVASQMEARQDDAWRADIVSRQAAADEAERQAASEIDPWAVALAQSGSRQHRAELLAKAITPWIREYSDQYGRTWHRLARDGNPSHTNSVFWQDIIAEANRRAIMAINEDIWKFAIKQAFSRLLANEPSEAADGAAVTQEADDGAAATQALDDLPIVATTDPRLCYQVAASNLRSAMQSLAAAASAIGDRDGYVANSIDRAIGSVRHLLTFCAEHSEA